MNILSRLLGKNAGDRPRWEYRPKEDVTAYEAALLVSLMTHPRRDPEKHPDWDKLRRHFIDLTVSENPSGEVVQ